VSRSKLWYPLVDFYGRLVPIILFVVAPSSIVTIVLIDLIVTEEEAYESGIARHAVSDALVYGYWVLGLGYGIIPIKFTNEKHFRRRGYESICTEFQTLKIVFVVLASLLMTVVSLELLVLSNDYIKSLDGLLTIATTGAGFRILTHLMHKEFRYYLAKGYCITAAKKEDEFDKANYLSATLDSYNKYLRRRTQIEIKDVKRIYATFLAAEIKEKNQIIKSVCESLEGDRLGLARYLSSVYKVPETEFFIEESNIQKMKPVGTFLAATIPIIVSIITLIGRT
jgi:hypothetical protein